MSCDVCLKPSDTLTPLNTWYQTASIRVVCPACEKAVDRELVRLRDGNARQLIAFMEAQRVKRPSALAILIEAMTLMLGMTKS